MPRQESVASDHLPPIMSIKLMRRHGTAAQDGASEGLLSVYNCLIGLQAFEMQVRILR